MVSIKDKQTGQRGLSSILALIFHPHGLIASAFSKVKADKVALLLQIPPSLSLRESPDMAG